MPADLTGLWTFDQGDHLLLDNTAAVQQGHTLPNGAAASHGTYVKKLWFRIYNLSDTSFYIFDQDGELAAFQWQSPEALKADGIQATDFGQTSMPDAWKYDVSANFKVANGQELQLLPHLALVSSASKWVPRRVEEPEQQYIWFDATDQTFYWLPSKPDPIEEGLQFHKYEPRERGPAKDKSKNFNDTFAGKSRIAQMTHPFYGYNPSAVGFGSSTANIWAGLLPAGTNHLDYTKTNPHQDLPHALLFEYPRPDSYDYNVGVGVGDNPALPYGVSFERGGCGERRHAYRRRNISLQYSALLVGHLRVERWNRKDAQRELEPCHS
jgi:hypothetical protein